MVRVPGRGRFACAAASKQHAPRTMQRVVRTAVLACVSFALAGTVSSSTFAAGTASSNASDSVVVRAAPGLESRVEARARVLGARIGVRLPIVDGFSARIPTRAVEQLRRTAGVVSVTSNASMQPHAASYSGASDVGSMYNVTLGTGAQEYWKAGYTGRGVDIAVIDSGVAPVDGLTAPGKVVNGPDLSFESQSPDQRYLDDYGHGTHVAGIIAGRAGTAVDGHYAGDQSNFLGMAPDARIVSVKVADAHGATDVSQVIAAIGWVVQHRRDNGLNIRVLNLSYGTDTAQPYAVDPLAYAAEQAWRAGIVVVAATGNAGFVKSGSMTDPAYDPTILAVGAADSMGTTQLADDRVASFSSSGGTSRHTDLVAPGAHIVSLRDPGSVIDQTYGSTGGVTASLFRGSGTSQAAAVVSGAAALIIQQRPTLTPDQVKALLTGSATTLKGALREAQGAGELNLATALKTATRTPSGTPVPSTGTGSLELSRGSTHLVQNGVTLAGERDIFGMPFSSPAIAALEANAISWSDGSWNGGDWSGISWSGISWSGISWSSISWSGISWSGISWSSISWSGISWSGISWSGISWSDNDWLADGWAANDWADASWG